MAEQVNGELNSSEQKVDPWTVKAAAGESTINYDKLIGIIILADKCMLIT